jgi:hypothetical protein
MRYIRSIAIAAIAITLVTPMLFKFARQSIQHDDVNPIVGSQDDGDKLKKLVEELVKSEWSELIPFEARIVKDNDLVECDAHEAEFVLTIKLWHRDSLLAEYDEHFCRQRGDTTAPDIFLKMIGCGLYTNGFLGGTYDFVGVSSEQIDATINWKFDDTARNSYVFDCKFTALVSKSGSVEVGHENRLDWSLNQM